MITAIDQYVIDKVREIRTRKNITQEQLAVAANIFSGFIGDVEGGKRGKKYNLRHLNAFAEVLECSPREFLPEYPIRQS